MKRFRFDGKSWRIRLTVFNLDHPPAFCVHVLPQYYNRLTPIASVGQQVYFGESLDSAWDAICKYNPHATLPAQLAKAKP